MGGLAAQEAETKVQGGEICQCHALPATPPGLAVITFISLLVKLCLIFNSRPAVIYY